MLMEELVLVNRSICYSCMGLSSITDVNECATDNGNCGQFCTNTVGSYTCSCNTSYSLNADARTCAGKKIID